MYRLRTLGIRDVVRALKQRKLRLAFRLAQCLASNVVKFRALSLASASASSRSSNRAEDTMIIEAAPSSEISGSTEAACATEIATPRGFWIAHAITIATGIGLQLVGLYAAAVTFGAWTTVGLYAVGGLAVVLQQAVLRRTSCSPGD